MASRIRIADGVHLDLDKLIHLLVTASTGAGKSTALRLLLEKTAGKIQQLVIDWEGEFSTLRETGDYVIVGRDGDLPAETRSVKLLARRMMEHQFSVILDLSEMPVDQRHPYVRDLLNTLVNLPRALWHDLLIVLDEAQKFAPEKERKGERSAAKAAVIDMASLGRKRGYKLVVASQRIAKLDKDVAAECMTKLVGGTNLADDQKRAVEEMGAKGVLKPADLMKLKPGEFYCVGPALGMVDVQRHRLILPKTSPPPKGSAARAPPPPKTKVKRVLEQLRDLPQQAEEEARTAADLEARVRDLKREISKARKENPPPEVKTERVEVPVLSKEDRDLLVESHQALVDVKSELGEMASQVATDAGTVESVLGRVESGLGAAKRAPAPKRGPAPAPRAPAAAAEPSSGPAASLPKGEMAVMKAVAMYQRAGRDTITVVTGYKRSSRDAYIQRLVGKGLLETAGPGEVEITSEGVEALGSEYEPLPVGRELQDYWLQRLPHGEAAILRVLIEDGGDVDREAISETTGYKRSSRDAYIQRLRQRRLVDIMGQGMVRASAVLFEEAVP